MKIWLISNGNLVDSTEIVSLQIWFSLDGNFISIGKSLWCHQGPRLCKQRGPVGLHLSNNFFERKISQWKPSLLPMKIKFISFKNKVSLNWNEVFFLIWFSLEGNLISIGSSLSDVTLMWVSLGVQAKRPVCICPITSLEDKFAMDIKLTFNENKVYFQ